MPKLAYCTWESNVISVADPQNEGKAVSFPGIGLKKSGSLVIFSSFRELTFHGFRWTKNVVGVSSRNESSIVSTSTPRKISQLCGL